MAVRTRDTEGGLNTALKVVSVIITMGFLSGRMGFIQTLLVEFELLPTALSFLSVDSAQCLHYSWDFHFQQTQQLAFISLERCQKRIRFQSDLLYASDNSNNLSPVWA